MDPDEFPSRTVAIQNGVQLLLRQGVELLDTNHRHIIAAHLLSMCNQIVVDLAAAQHNTGDRRGIGDQRIVQHQVEPPGDQLVHATDGFRVPQQALGRQDDQRFAEVPLHLPAKHVEHLGRGGGVDHLHVVVGAQLQEPLRPGGRVLRTLAFIAVWQEQGQTAVALPLHFSRGDELIEVDLSTVGKIAELRLPDHQHLRIAQRIAVLEAHAGRLSERAVVDAEPRLFRLDVVERVVSLPGRGLILQHGMTMAERAALDVLAGQPNGMVVQQQGSVGQQLTHRPVQRQILRHGLAPVRKQLVQLPVRDKPVRDRSESTGDRVEPLFGDRSLHLGG